VLTVTLCPSLDMAASVPVVQAERKLRCGEPLLSAGGGGINVARAALRLGQRATALFPAGGSSGEQLCALARADGVPIAAVPIVEPTRQNLNITEMSSGRLYRFVFPGPPLRQCELERCADEVVRLARAERHVVFSGLLPTNCPGSYLSELIVAVRRGGSDVIVDTSGDALAKAAAAGTLLLKPSINELCQFAGQSLATHIDFEVAARELLALGDNEAVLVSLAAAGALLVQRERRTAWIHAPSVRAISAVGAGDAMVAGVVVGLERGWSLPDSARLGVAAGTAAVMTEWPDLLRPVDVETLLPLVRATDGDELDAD
jgi:6-phosphofructokinase 2